MRKGFAFIFVLLTLSALAILFDIAFFRQILGFLFFTTIPGLLILYILKINKLGLTEKFVLSVGLSVSFLTFFGLLFNTVGPRLGYTTPLTTTPLVIYFSALVLALAIIAYLRNREAFSISRAAFHLDSREKAFLILPAFLPMLSIIGMRLMNTIDNNSILMLVLFLIPAYVIFIAVKRRQVPDRVYPPLIFLIAISIVLMALLRSSYIMGADIHAEYHLFQLTDYAQYWQVLPGTAINTSLVISLLVTVYQRFLNMSPEFVFQLIHYSLFAVLPLVIYIISRKYIGNFWAFLSSFFVMSQLRFVSGLGGLRTDIAVLFFALAAMVLMHDGLSEFNKRALFMIFIVSCVVSHYSTTYILLFVLLFAWISTQIMPRIIYFSRRGKWWSVFFRNPSTRNDPPSPANQSTTPVISLPQLKSRVTIGMMLLLFVIIFIWYSQLTGTAFQYGVLFIDETFGNLHKFFILESRGGVVEAIAGVGLAAKAIPSKIEFFFSWAAIAFIATGVLTALYRSHRVLAFSGNDEATPHFLARKMDVEFFSFAIASSIVMVLAIVLPFVATGYNPERVFFQVMVCLSPFFVMGGILAARFFRVRRVYLLVLAVLIPYFMCTSGTMYQVFNYPRSILLNSTGALYDSFYVHEQEFYAARWIGGKWDDKALVYSTHRGWQRLQSLMIAAPRPELSRGLLTAYSGGHLPGLNAYIYLRYQNVAKGEIAVVGYESRSMAEDYPGMLDTKSKIYTSNGAEVYR